MISGRSGMLSAHLKSNFSGAEGLDCRTLRGTAMVRADPETSNGTSLTLRHVHPGPVYRSTEQLSPLRVRLMSRSYPCQPVVGSESESMKRSIQLLPSGCV